MAKKGAAAKAPAKKPPKAHSDAKADSDSGSGGVSVRMYKQGLGDCFLLSFAVAGRAKPVRVMIDCGVLKRTENEAIKLRSVVDDIAEETGGVVDLLIITHEHWDHIAGFSHAEDYFKTQPGQKAPKLQFGRVWLSWAENAQGDDLARSVLDDLGKKKKAARVALGLVDSLGLEDRWTPLAASNDANARRMIDDVATARAVFAFLGEDPTPASKLAAAGAAAAKPAARPPGVTGLSLGETMDWLRSLVKPGDFCVPGQRRAVPGVDGVTAYILGPPRDESLIKKMDATGEEGYALASKVSFLGAAERLEAPPDGKPAPGPFSVKLRVSREQAMDSPFFRKAYGFPDDPLGDEGETWRRIDDEWLTSGLGQLALQIDSRVNNTSLAIAFELADGRTLIFPGDAQFGNWLSWDDLKFQDEAGKDLASTTKQLLNRAVFYKVGHHGSHNATRPASLHQMTGSDLVAMIPTDEVFALKQPKPGSWRMPAQGVAADVAKFTANRILRADRAAAELDKLAKQEGAATDWAAFASRVTFSEKPLLPGLDPVDFPLWVEYRL